MELSPESVGTFIEVGDDAKGMPLASMACKNRSRLLVVDYAKDRTSASKTTITRGSPRTTDDLLTQKGQTGSAFRPHGRKRVASRIWLLIAKYGI